MLQHITPFRKRIMTSAQQWTDSGEMEEQFPRKLQDRFPVGKVDMKEFQFSVAVSDGEIFSPPPLPLPCTYLHLVDVSNSGVSSIKARQETNLRKASNECLVFPIKFLQETTTGRYCRREAREEKIVFVQGTYPVGGSAF